RVPLTVNPQLLPILPHPRPPRPHEPVVVRRRDQDRRPPVPAAWPVHVGSQRLAVPHRDGGGETVETGVGGDNPVLGRQRRKHGQRQEQRRLSHQPTIIDESRYNSDCSPESRSSSSRSARGASCWSPSSILLESR